MTRGLILAAPSSNSGKTTVTLALLRALKRLGVSVAPAKTGPDYIDPRFHEIAASHHSVNLDPWAMRADLIQKLAANHAAIVDFLLIEGVMGLFDGATGGAGSTADLAAGLGLPVLLVLDVKGQAQSAAAIAQGFRHFRPDVHIAGVLLNRVGSDRHLTLLREAFETIDLPIIGALRNNPDLVLPSRHLGLVQAMEQDGLDSLIDKAAETLVGHLDHERLLAIAGEMPGSVASASSDAAPLAPLGQRIAVAWDEAYAFSYPHMLRGWQEAGAELSFFSPLKNGAPDERADAIFLPGGYPELHGATLASSDVFKTAMKAAARRNALIYGECGGYMTLGKAIIDTDGTSHPMLNLLPLVTSFQTRKLHLGYRRVTIPGESGLPWRGPLRAHEFHYASIVEEGDVPRLFEATDASGTERPQMGLRSGSVMGSFAHLIDHE
ncbi:cobyrinate a,c-diamide synthase [Coralliovum pocilloporae]|uniref:cobyrinate a,c-diamide synthase n=1 Tax=Coralliovum pocilloporae TaxID=3066369 RepID=UPI0033075990